MPQKLTHSRPKTSSKPAAVQRSVKSRLVSIVWPKHWLKRALVIACAFVFLATSSFYGIAVWYQHTQADKPFRYGATFIPDYARQFGLDPKDTLRAIINDLGIKQLRLVSYWKYGEPQPGQYDFSELDWQFRMAEEAGAKVSLAIGLRQPRWPECHAPKWAEAKPMSEWSVDLKNYMGKTIERYKNSPALESYQLENEFFMDVFGICPDFTRERLVDEYNYVKIQDPNHPVIISRSNNWIGIPINEPTPDIFGITVYKRVWDKTITKRYYEYPLPPWFYAGLAGAGKIATGKDMIIHELQTEAWLPDGWQMNDVNDIPEMNKSLDAKRLEDRLQYAHDTGLRDIYLWGVEWWYWQKTKANDPALWNTAKSFIAKSQAETMQSRPVRD